MRDKQAEIIAEFAKVDGTAFTLDNAFENLDTLTHCEGSFDHQTSAYDEVWEHPSIAKANEGKTGAARDLGSVFFTLYALKPEHEVRDWRPAFKFVVGRIGNTSVINID
jgi:hypothetical protein